VDSVDPLVVELDASDSTDPNDDIAVYMWTFGDDVTILTPLDYTKTVDVPVLLVRYPVAGTYAVQLLVRDETGRVSDPVLGNVTVPNIPVEPMP
jgi:PKD repeat protein